MSMERSDVLAVQVSSLRKVYGNVVAVDDVSFEVERGSVFCIIGPNGAGKTTTIECLEGLRRPDGGSVLVAGLDPISDHTFVHKIGAGQAPRNQRPCDFALSRPPPPAGLRAWRPSPTCLQGMPSHLGGRRAPTPEFIPRSGSTGWRSSRPSVVVVMLPSSSPPSAAHPPTECC